VTVGEVSYRVVDCISIILHSSLTTKANPSIRDGSRPDIAKYGNCKSERNETGRITSIRTDPCKRDHRKPRSASHRSASFLRSCPTLLSKPVVYRQFPHEFEPEHVHRLINLRASIRSTRPRCRPGLFNNVNAPCSARNTMQTPSGQRNRNRSSLPRNRSQFCASDTAKCLLEHRGVHPTYDDACRRPGVTSVFVIRQDSLARSVSANSLELRLRFLASLRGKNESFTPPLD